MGNKALEEKEQEEQMTSEPSQQATEIDSASENSSTVDSTKVTSYLQSLANDSQKVYCLGKDSDVPYLLNAKEVTVQCSEASSCGSESASNQVRVSQVSKFDSEQKLYVGNLVACNRTYIAYVVRVKVGSNDHVRILNHHTSSRALLKCFKGKVVDLAFSGPSSNQLACIDENGCVTLINLDEDQGAVKFHISMQLQLKLKEYSSPETNRLFWSLTLPDPSNSEDKPVSHIIAVTNGNTVEIFNLNCLMELKPTEPLNVDELKDGVVRIEDGHQKTVTKVVISPEESVFATSSLDGYVKFWQLDFASQDKPECLHDWQPHDGNPVTELIFCDNQHDKSEDAPPMWRFLITGTKNNAVLKLWCAVTWNVLQTLSFSGGNLEGGMDLWNPAFKVTMDLSGSYLLLSDVTRQVLYICNFVQDSDGGVAYFSGVSEYVLAQPLLSFAIYRIKKKLSKPESKLEGALDITNGVHDKSDDMERVDGASGSGDDQFDESKQVSNIAIELFGVHTKALQLLTVQTAFSAKDISKHDKMLDATGSQDDITDLNDVISDVSSIADSNSGFPQEDLTASASASTLEEKLSIALQSLDLSMPVLPQTGESAPDTMEEVDGSATAKPQEEELPDILASSSSSVNNKVSSLDVCIEKQTEITALQAGPPDMVQLGTSREDEGSLDVITHEQRPVVVAASTSPVTSTPTEVSEIAASRIPTSIQSNEDVPSTVRRQTPKISRTASLEQSPIKSLHISAESSVIPKASNSCCAEALEAIRAENREMRVMLSQLLETTTQQRELMTSQLNEQRSEREAVKADYKTVAKSTTAGMSKSTKELMKNINAKLDSQLNELKTSNQEREHQLAQNLAASMMNSLRDKVNTSLKESIRESVVPSISNMIKSSMDKINAEVIVKMSAIEKKVKDDMEGFVKSKEVTNSIAHACTGALHKTLTNIYRDELRSTVVPEFSKAVGVMFTQLNSSFSSGTRQYLTELESHLSKVQLDNEQTTAPISAELKKVVALLQTSTEGKQTEKMVNKEINNAFGRLQKTARQHHDETMNTIKGSVQEILEGLSSRIESSATGASAPSAEDTQETIREYVDAGEVSKAFELALSVTNLHIVSFVCELVDPDILFETSPCPLSQPIILSLIQQLSADLGSDTVKKCNYIIQAIVALDSNDKTTSLHLNDIVQGLLKQILIYIEDTEPKGAEMKALRNLKLTASGVLQ